MKRNSRRTSVLALAIAGGFMVSLHSTARAEDGVACGNCTNLLAIPAIEEVPEHAFGWTFGAPEAFCRLAPDSRIRLDSPPKIYRGAAFRKVFVLSGACAGHAGWIPQGEAPATHAPMPAATEVGK